MESSYYFSYYELGRAKVGGLSGLDQAVFSLSLPGSAHLQLSLPYIPPPCLLPPSHYSWQWSSLPLRPLHIPILLRLTFLSSPTSALPTRPLWFRTCPIVCFLCVPSPPWMARAPVAAAVPSLTSVSSFSFQPVPFFSPEVLAEAPHLSYNFFSLGGLAEWPRGCRRSREMLSHQSQDGSLSLFEIRGCVQPCRMAPLSALAYFR